MYSYPHKTAYRELNVKFSEYAERLRSEQGSNLYFHIPFCTSKCGYCNLFSVTGKEAEYFSKYIDALEKQAEWVERVVGSDCWESVTIGGGTPLILAENQLEELFKIGLRLTNGKKVPICIETAPGETTESKLDILKKFGVDRISIGVQSFNNDELLALKRFHNVEKAEKALKSIGKYNFPCLNIDLIYGIEGQTLDSLKYSVDSALKYFPDELFIYPLYIRKGTGLHKSGRLEGGKTYEMYLFLREYLSEKGFLQTSMRRFTRQKPLNERSCGFENTVSIGCGGRSYIGNLHFCHPYSVNRRECLETIDDYIKNPCKDDISHGFLLDREEEKRRFTIKNLLWTGGVSLPEYKEYFESDVGNDFPFINEFKEKGYICENDGVIQLTPLGLSLSDFIGPRFISTHVSRLMEGSV